MTLLQANLVVLSCLFYDQTRELIIKFKMRLNLFQESPDCRCGELGNLELFFVDPFFFFFFCLYWISYNIGSVLFWSVGCKVWRILTPWSEIEPTLSAMEGSLNHWTTGKSRVGQFRRRNMQKVYFYLCVTASHYPQEGKQAWGDNTLTEKVLV